MASGLIYLAIVGMWAAYFVPRWVHSHDDFSGKSVERYKSALRTVAIGPASESLTSASSDSDYESKTAQTLLRRRIIFGLLTLALLLSIFEVAFNSVAIVYSLLPLTGFVIYIAHVRSRGVAERLHRRRVEQLHRSNDGVFSTNLSQVLAPRDSRSESKEHWIPLAERESSGVVILPKGSAQDRNTWQPNTVPVPTYVTAPKAVTPKRVIDLTVPGAWSAEQERLASAALSAVAPARDEVFDQLLAEEAVERLRQNRASNE
ncbi:MAG: hypothetical protein WCK79_07535 [Actinomycetes bacterium]